MINKPNFLACFTFFIFFYRINKFWGDGPPQAKKRGIYARAWSDYSNWAVFTASKSYIIQAICIHIQSANNSNENLQINFLPSINCADKLNVTDKHVHCGQVYMLLSITFIHVQKPTEWYHMSVASLNNNETKIVEPASKEILVLMHLKQKTFDKYQSFGKKRSLWTDGSCCAQYHGTANHRLTEPCKAHESMGCKRRILR